LFWLRFCCRLLSGLDEAMELYPNPNRNPYPNPYDETMELPASAQDGPSSARQIVEPPIGGRWDEALELERRAFRLRNGLPPGGKIFFFQKSPWSYYLTSDDRHFTICHIEDGDELIVRHYKE
jgi:hypothetical protein